MFCVQPQGKYCLLLKMSEKKCVSFKREFKKKFDHKEKP